MKLFIKHTLIFSILFVLMACNSKSKHNHSEISVASTGESLFALSEFPEKMEERVISINPNEATTWNLSQIAESITPISLSSYKDFSKNKMQYVYLTDDYIFVVGATSIAQLDRSGKHIRTIYCDDYINDITGDAAQKEIYICTKSKVICYDYALKVKKTIHTQFRTNSIFYHQNKVWIGSFELKGDRDTTRQFSVGTITHRISSWDRINETEIFLPFELNQDYERAAIPQRIVFSVYNDQLVFSNGMNSTLYVIQNDNVFPFIRYEIEPSGDLKYILHPYAEQRFTGKNLWITYYIANRSTTDITSPIAFNSENYIYFEDTETGQAYNIHDTLYDDMYHTGDLNIFRIYKDYFIVFRAAFDLQKSTNLKIPTDSQAFFIGKFKTPTTK